MTLERRVPIEPSESRSGLLNKRAHSINLCPTLSDLFAAMREDVLPIDTAERVLFHFPT